MPHPPEKIFFSTLPDAVNICSINALIIKAYANTLITIINEITIFTNVNIINI